MERNPNIRRYVHGTGKYLYGDQVMNSLLFIYRGRRSDEPFLHEIIHFRPSLQYLFLHTGVPLLHLYLLSTKPTVFSSHDFRPDGSHLGWVTLLMMGAAEALRI